MIPKLVGALALGGMMYFVASRLLRDEGEPSAGARRFALAMGAVFAIAAFVIVTALEGM